MTLGNGIFFASLIMSITALYIATKDRWNWKKIILWPVGIFLVVGLAIGGWLYIEQLASDINPISEPTIQESFWGLTLNDSKADIKFKKGEPTKNFENGWAYETNQVNGWESYLIFFKEDKVRFILYGASSDFDAPYLQKIKFNDSSADIFKTFGKPSNISISNNDLERTYSYEKYHLFFTLEKDKVRSYGIYNPTFGPIQLNNGKEATSK